MLQATKKSGRLSVDFRTSPVVLPYLARLVLYDLDLAVVEGRDEHDGTIGSADTHVTVVAHIYRSGVTAVEGQTALALAEEHPEAAAGVVNVHFLVDVYVVPVQVRGIEVLPYEGQWREITLHAEVESRDELLNKPSDGGIVLPLGEEPVAHTLTTGHAAQCLAYHNLFVFHITLR